MAGRKFYSLDIHCIKPCLSLGNTLTIKHNGLFKFCTNLVEVTEL